MTAYLSQIGRTYDCASFSTQHDHPLDRAFRSENRPSKSAFSYTWREFGVRQHTASLPSVPSKQRVKAPRAIESTPGPEHMELNFQDVLEVPPVLGLYLHPGSCDGCSPQTVTLYPDHDTIPPVPCPRSLSPCFHRQRPIPSRPIGAWSSYPNFFGHRQALAMKATFTSRISPPKVMDGPSAITGPGQYMGYCNYQQ